jgi:hypothetical protein
MADLVLARHYLIAADESEGAAWSLNYATSSMDKELDVLHILSVRKDEEVPLGMSAYAFAARSAEMGVERKQTERLLRRFARQAHKNGVSMISIRFEAEKIFFCCCSC